MTEETNGAVLNKESAENINKDIDFDNKSNNKKRKTTKLMPGLPGFHVKTEDLLPASDEEREQLVRMRESSTYWKDVKRRFMSNKVAIFSLIVLFLVVIFAFVGPIISPYGYSEQIRGHERQSPSLQHLMGTDSLGRDMMTRVMMGTRISLMVGLVASVLETLIGGTYGAIAGYVGGTVDNIMMRIAEIIYSLPDILIIIILSMALEATIRSLYTVSWLSGIVSLGSGLISVFITFSLLYWVGMARMMRSQVLSLKQMEYATVAKSFGAKGSKIVSKHLIPNSMSTIIVTAMFQIPQAIFAESFLSFVGLGVSAPMASLGSLASDGLGGITSYPYLIIAPAVMISIIMLAFNQFGDGLRDALDPKLKE